MKKALIGAIGGGAAALSGCSGSFSRVMDSVAEAPGWYAERRQEIRGEGYPEIGAVPEVAPAVRNDQSLELTKEESRLAKAAFLADPRSEFSTMSGDDIEALAASWREGLDRDLGPENFLTEDEIARMRRLFYSRRPS
ncbi:MAG: hypothetical protein AAFX03_03745 [Pseudomonadota bacterium]